MKREEKQNSFNLLLLSNPQFVFKIGWTEMEMICKRSDNFSGKISLERTIWYFINVQPLTTGCPLSNRTINGIVFLDDDIIKSLLEKKNLDTLKLLNI